MVRLKIDDFVEDIGLGLLKQNISCRKIAKQNKQMRYNSVSVATKHRIQHGKGAIRENIRKTGKT